MDWVCLMALYYYPEENYFTDEDGYVVYDIFSYITPNELTWFLHNKESLCFIRADGYFIEVNYLEDK